METYYQKNRERILARTKIWQSENRDRLNAYAKKYRASRGEEYRVIVRSTIKRWAKENPDKVLASRRRTRDKLRSDVLGAYGGMCACCGETQREFLAIDHINNDGAEHRRQENIKSAQAMYTWLRRNNYPSGFQVLCHNCNCAKGYYGVCPHVKALAVPAFR